jgi:transposase
MGQVLHGSATTTEAVRRAIRLREESVRSLAKRYGVSPTTVQKWRKRTSTADARMGPKEPRSTVLTVEEEAIVVAFRRHTLLPLDDCLYGLQPTIPHLTRSSLHRCLERHGISRLPEIDGDKPKKQRFATYAIGYVHIDIAEVTSRPAQEVDASLRARRRQRDRGSLPADQPGCGQRCDIVMDPPVIAAERARERADRRCRPGLGQASQQSQARVRERRQESAPGLECDDGYGGRGVTGLGPMPRLDEALTHLLK